MYYVKQDYDGSCGLLCIIIMKRKLFFFPFSPGAVSCAVVLKTLHWRPLSTYTYTRPFVHTCIYYVQYVCIGLYVVQVLRLFLVVLLLFTLFCCCWSFLLEIGVEGSDSVLVYSLA